MCTVWTVDVTIQLDDIVDVVIWLDENIVLNIQSFQSSGWMMTYILSAAWMSTMYVDVIIWLNELMFNLAGNVIQLDNDIDL